MNYDIMVSNVTRIIEDIVTVLNISHTMTQYDYIKMVDELDNLRAPTGVSHRGNGSHPITQMQPHHSQTSYECDMDRIINVLQKDENCTEYYEFVNDLMQKETDMS